MIKDTPPHAHRIVSLIYNPEVKRQGQLLSSYELL
jgi:hypothetical protein